MTVTKPMRLTEFERLPPRVEAALVEGLPVAIDAVAASGHPSRGFLRHAWFAAAVEAYGGPARTVVVRQEGEPVLALPFVAVGPERLRLASLVGCYWPFRGFPLASHADEAALGAALHLLARTVRAFRIGPAPDDDPATARLLDAARARGWAALDRFVGQDWVFDLGAATRAGEWPRASTLKKNRFFEKHLAAHGALEWRTLGADDWPAAFDALAAIEERSWIAARTDGSDAKFTTTGHGAFWRALARDPAARPGLHAALLTVDGRPAAFSFDLLAGDSCYAIANSYDPLYAKQSPGRLLYTRNLVGLAERGVETVDWGMGDSGYKQVIGAREGAAMRDWLLLPPGLPALAARALKGWWGRSGQTRT
jgi:CelD/BcsL family acetyltransferase involved in cellulose biosynthesis